MTRWKKGREKGLLEKCKKDSIEFSKEERERDREAWKRVNCIIRIRGRRKKYEGRNSEILPPPGTSFLFPSSSFSLSSSPS